MASRSGPKLIGLNNLVACFDAGNFKSYDTGMTPTTPNAQTAYTTPGTYSFVVPVGITSISAVCVGGGGGGGGNSASNADSGAGGGGGLAYGTFAVTPGETLNVIVGAGGAGGGLSSGTAQDGIDGGNSLVSSSSSIFLQGNGGEHGGKAYINTYGSAGSGGTFSGIATVTGGGGNGGNGGAGGGGAGGGGGAAGYSGNGGNGKNFPGAGAGTDGAGGGGGGAGSWASGGFGSAGAAGNNKGGGVGILGEGSNGAGGAAYNPGSPGSGGSGATYGGGGGGAYRNSNTGGDGGGGAVRLVYQPTIGNRQYPDGSGTLSNLADTTYSFNVVSDKWKDISGKGLIANLNGPVFDAANFGSMSFDGTDDYATFDLLYSDLGGGQYPPGGIQNIANFRYGTGTFTIEIWTSWTSKGADGYSYFLDFRRQVGDTLYVNTRPLLYESGQSGNVGRISFYLYNEGNAQYTSSGQPFSGSPNPWTQLLFSRGTQGTTNNVKWFINGALSSQGNYSENQDYYTEQISIGRGYGGGTTFLNGKIAMIRIYKDKAFTAAEASSHYETFRHRFGI